MSGLYLHIPFCKQKCIYCDFYSLVNERLQDRYVTCLINELNDRIREVDNITTIYIGGGTPSILSLNLLEKLITALHRVVDFSEVIEFTIEVNPDDVTLDFANFIKSMGINRVSMGVQSFNDNELKIINRRHSSSQVKEAIGCLRNAGINNICIDLMFGLPEQTLDSWLHTIDEALGIGVEHISAYSLMYEEGTRLYQMLKLGKISECNEELSLRMYESLTSKLSAAGYIHYEISNYALPGRTSAHNSSYWNETPYIGLGPGAHSYDGEIRKSNPHNLKQYIESLSNNKCVFIVEHESQTEKYNDYILTRLRTILGINKADIKRKFGDKLYTHFMSEFSKYENSGDVKINSNGNIILSETGMMKSDLIIRDLFLVE